MNLLNFATHRVKLGQPFIIATIVAHPINCKSKANSKLLLNSYFHLYMDLIRIITTCNQSFPKYIIEILHFYKAEKG